MDHKLNFFLMGKTGCGKSATGNSLLDRKVFKVSSSATSETKEVQYYLTTTAKHVLLVVDGPGLEDTDIDVVEKKENEIKNMEIALSMCYEGVDAFLLVEKFPSRFTKENQRVVEDLKRLFGKTYFDHVIVVVTGGDLFEKEKKEKEDEGEEFSFESWCNSQQGAFAKLYKDCCGRIVLINNKETDEGKKQAQIQEIIRHTEVLKAKYGRYTSECFKQAGSEREKLLMTLKLPKLTIHILENISLLSADIEKFLAHPNHAERIKIEERIQEIKHEIEDQDKDGILAHLKDMVVKVQENLNDKIKLKCLAEDMEEARRSSSMWKQIGKFVLGILKVAVTVAVPLAIKKAGKVLF